MFTQIYTNQLTYKNEGTHIGGNEIYFFTRNTWVRTHHGDSFRFQF